jgi:hypothetical protein
MKRWNQVKWTEAGQVRAILGWPPSDRDADSPETFFDALRAEGRDEDAVMFLGQALPRFEVVAWAARAVRNLSPPDPPRADAEALKTALLWLQDPSDNRRRAAFEASSQIEDVSPQRLCALAVFFSGGSLAPTNVEPVPTPRDAAGKFAAGAVLTAVARSGDRKMAMTSALRLGDAVACGRDADQP